MKRMLRTLFVFLVLACLGVVHAELAMVEMRDGVKLATEYFLPQTGAGPYPALLLRSFYGRKGGPDLAAKFNPEEVAVVIQDVRGRGDSEGVDAVFGDDGWGERQDGADTVDWVLAQPWCNGKVGTMGGSALGITQVQMAGATQKVVCQFIEVAASNFYDQVSYQGGVFRKALIENWSTAVKCSHIIDIWHGHPSYDAFWEGFNAEKRAPEITAPAVHVGGWFDIFAQGTLNNFKTRQEQGGTGARDNQILVMGPWPHGQIRKVGELEFPENFRFDTAELQRRFFRYWLLGEPNGVMDEPPVHYYTMGDCSDPNAPGNEWRTAAAWPPFETIPVRLYLHEGGRLSTNRPTNRLARASFVYDPAGPCPTHGGQNLTIPAGSFDQRTLADRQDILRFETAPLDQPMEVTGNVRAILYVSTDARDTDFTAKLIDVYPDGREMLILDNIRRLKYRKGFEKPEPLRPGRVGRLEIDLWSTSLIFNCGHKIALHVSSSNYPRFEKNPNSGDDFPTETNLRIAHNTVHFGPRRPSAVVLPVRPDDVEKTLK